MTSLVANTAEEKHTPTPWDFSPCSGSTNFVSFYGKDGNIMNATGGYDSDLGNMLSICGKLNDNAAHIVHCVNSFDALTEANARMRVAMFKAELGLAAAQNDQLEIERWMNRDGETHEECKRRLIAEGRAALKAAKVTP